MCGHILINLGRLSDLNAPKREVERFYYNRLINFLDSTFPQWRLWKAPFTTYRKLFGDVISEETNNEILFAISMDSLAQVFGGAVAALTVADVRTLQALLLRWDIGRALIVQPEWLSNIVKPIDRFEGRSMNPLMWRSSLESVVESATGVHGAYCGSHVPVERAPWARGPLSPRAAQRMWNDFTLEEAVGGTQGPFHVCDAFPGFDVDNRSE